MKIIYALSVAAVFLVTGLYVRDMNTFYLAETGISFGSVLLYSFFDKRHGEECCMFIGNIIVVMLALQCNPAKNEILKFESTPALSGHAMAYICIVGMGLYGYCLGSIRIISKAKNQDHQAVTYQT